MPVDQITLSERGAAAPEVDETNEKSKSTIAPSKKSTKLSSPDRVSSGIVKDVALKVIPKKKVKESEANVWGEMEVLKGLDHPNIVSIDFWSTGLPVSSFPIRLNSTNGLNPGQNITSHLNLRLAVNSLRGF